MNSNNNNKLPIELIERVIRVMAWPGNKQFKAKTARFVFVPFLSGLWKTFDADPATEDPIPRACR
jgi:hypothetical protein